MSSVARDEPWAGWQRVALLVGAAGYGLLVLGWVLALVLGSEALLRKVFYAYLWAYLFSLAFPLGSLAIWLLHNQTGGSWGQIIRRYLEAWTRVIPFMALLFIPIVLGIRSIYVWADPELIERFHDEEFSHLLAGKSAYLNVPGFIVRACVYFGVWSLISWLVNTRQAHLDRNPDDAVVARRHQLFSGPGLVLYGLSMTFAAIDWIMSLEPAWYSTIFPIFVVMGQTLPSFAFAIAAAAFRYQTVVGPTPPTHGHVDAGPLTEVEVSRDAWNDLGNLLLASVMLWTYMAFSQLLLIWVGNLREEVPFYLIRSSPGWTAVNWLLGLCYFAVPFLLLLSRRLKRSPTRLLRVACLILCITVVYYFWLVTPVYSAITMDPPDLKSGDGFTIGWLDFAALAGVGGVTFALFLWQLGRNTLTPPPVLVQMQEAVHA